jgi:tetratricopeptide (TPR) repeat protein
MRFEIIRTLGSGSTGVVQLARDTERGGALVAVKRLHPHLQFTLEQETTLAQSVSHRNVCRVHDVHREDGCIVISMEHVDGETLRAVIQRHAKSKPPHMALSEGLHILQQILDGVEEAHAQGVSHCDLKPENVMINREGAVKIMDFGLAMRAATTIVQRQARAGAGTPGCMAPEHLEGKADARSDVYALGGILYEILTGCDARKRPLAFPDDTPPDLRRVVTTCLKKNPDRRFQSVAELRHALREPVAWRPLASYTGILAVCLLLTVAIAIAFALSVRPRRAGAGALPAAKAQSSAVDSVAGGNASPPLPQPETARLLADGESFLQNDMVDDALAQFERALQLDDHLTEAHFQRGLALVKLKRWDEAIAAFKRALPGSASERRVLWQWTSHFAPGSAHGVIWVKPNKVLFGERKGTDTILQLVELEQHRVRRLLIPDDHIRLNDYGLANDRLTILLSYDIKGSPNALRLYAVSPDASVLWHLDLQDGSAQLPWIGIVPRGFFAYFPSSHRLSFYDERSPQPRWTRRDVQFNRNLDPVALTNAIVLAEVTAQGSRYHAVDLADGSDDWTLDVPKIASMVVPARDEDILYFVTKSGEMIAVELGGDAARIVWRKPTGRDIVSLRAGAH